ncbi:MAG: hypothetical protein OWQ48_03635 [Desulfurococcus sp.]|nr:hypothetical protein [Desulfurococcus sp.]
MKKTEDISLRVVGFEELLVLKYIGLLEELKALEIRVESSKLDEEDKNKLKSIIRMIEEAILQELEEWASIPGGQVARSGEAPA